MSLTSEQFDQWVTLLRDPDQRQARCTLKDEEGARCCLGVLAESVLGLNLPPDDHEPAYDAVTETLTTIWPLANRNDGAAGQRKHTFPEIADYLEEHRDEYVA